MNLSSMCSVPAAAGAVKPPAQAVDTVIVCPECWMDTDSVMTFFGRELCPDCAHREEDAFDAAQCSAWEEMEFGRHEQMSSMGSVLAGMGF